jgi:hypothetical protein
MFNIVHEVKDRFLLSERKKPKDNGQVRSVGLVDDLVQVGRRTSPEESLDGVQKNSCAIDGYIHCSSRSCPILIVHFLAKKHTS